MPERLLKFRRIGIAQLEQITDDVIAVGNPGLVGNDRHAGGARIFASANHFDDVALLRWNKRIAI